MDNTFVIIAGNTEFFERKKINKKIFGYLGGI